jgi:S-adenosylmethionine:tRNA ribosyltransferase-isomerase
MNADLMLSSYDFDLSKELIAQMPAEKRDMSRLLVLDRKTGKIEHSQFANIVEYLLPGDCLVLNTKKVLPARLYGKKQTGGIIEALFLKQNSETTWLALVKPYLEPGKSIIFPDGLNGKIVGRNGSGETIIELSGCGLRDVLEKYGKMPLPPYIKREKIAEDKDAVDRERYQTIFAEREGSIAAPTAGLHFTKELLAAAASKGVETADIVLHVGWGTFRPVISEDITCHKMLPEYFDIPADSARAISDAKRQKRRVIVVGTTAARALESRAGEILTGQGAGLSGETGIFIYPGHKFAVPDCFITNFHLPRSTPLFMASAFAGRELILNAYAEAIREKYRFFSYGDAMLIL